MSDETDLLILLIDVVIKTHGYEDLKPFVERLDSLKQTTGYEERGLKQ